MSISNKELCAMKSKSHRSKLSEVKDEILEMRNESISYKLIQQWLLEQGIKTTIQNIQQFYKRNKSTLAHNKGRQNTTKDPEKNANSNFEVFRNITNEEEELWEE